MPFTVLSSRMVSCWRSMSVWKKSASTNANESALIGLFRYGRISELLIVCWFALLLPCTRLDNGLYGCIGVMAFGSRRGAFCLCFV